MPCQVGFEHNSPSVRRASCHRCELGKWSDPVAAAPSGSQSVKPLCFFPGFPRDIHAVGFWGVVLGSPSGFASRERGSTLPSPLPRSQCHFNIDTLLSLVRLPSKLSDFLKEESPVLESEPARQKAGFWKTENSLRSYLGSEPHLLIHPSLAMRLRLASISSPFHFHCRRKTPLTSI